MKMVRYAAIRGLMLDPARLIERHAFYFDLLPFLQRWGINTLWWHFADDQGFVLRLDGHPELATPHAFTKPEMRRFIIAAQAHGIEVVPEVEALGHARYITRLPCYRHLANGDPTHFNAVCPSHPETLPLLREVIAEVADLFPCPHFHAGMDEVDFKGCPRCQRRAAGKPAWWVYAEHVRSVHQVVTACGKRMIIWADHVEKEPALLRVLPRDIILAHWQYTDVRPDAIRRSLDAGFETIAVPAMCHWGDMIQPNTRNFDNMEAMVAAVDGMRRHPPLGIVNSWWTAWRGIRGAYLFAVSYTGQLLFTESPRDRRAAAQAFLADHFGLRRRAAADALLGLHAEGLTLDEMACMLPDSAADVTELVARAGTQEYESRRQQVTAYVHTLAAAGSGVRRQCEDFDSILFAGRIAVACFEQGHRLRAFHGACRHAEFLRDRGCALRQVSDAVREAEKILAEALRVLDLLCDETARDWNRTRHADDPIKGNRRRSATACGPDMLLGRMYRSRDYLQARLRDLRTRRRRGQLATLLP